LDQSVGDFAMTRNVPDKMQAARTAIATESGGRV